MHSFPYFSLVCKTKHEHIWTCTFADINTTQSVKTVLNLLWRHRDTHSPYECKDFLLNMSDTKSENPEEKEELWKSSTVIRFIQQSLELSYSTDQLGSPSLLHLPSAVSTLAHVQVRVNTGSAMGPILPSVKGCCFSPSAGCWKRPCPNPSPRQHQPNI